MSRLHHIAVINESSVVDDAELAAISRALQRQVTYDFAPLWGINAIVNPIPKGQTPPSGAWWLVILDNMDQAGALGYHDLTPELLPIGKVGAKTDLKYGAKVSVTCSHELLEMLGDPWINLLVEDPTRRRIYAYENCDAVEADELGYDHYGITVSDFVLPIYFDPNHAKRGVKLSFRGNVSEPFSLAPGGYLSYCSEGGEWQQETAAHVAGGLGHVALRPGDVAPDRVDGARQAGFPEGSRRERRIRAAEGKLVVSTAHAEGLGRR